MITKVAEDKNNFANRLLYTDSAREGFTSVLGYIKQKNGFLNILLPAYIGITDREGSGIFDPVQHHNASFEFYRVSKDLVVDIDHLQQLITAQKFNVFLLVHYFGICKNDVRVIREICTANDIVLIEDCAHAFHLGLPEEKLGVIGDFSFYSVHKFLPVNSGGIVKINMPDVFPSAFEGYREMDKEVAYQLFKTDYRGIAAKRKSIFNLYMDQLKSVQGIEIMYELEDHEIPQTFPIIIKNGRREKLYFYLIEKGIVLIALYYRLIDEITKVDFPVSHDISFSILNLPVHQDIEEKDAILICKEIKNFFEHE